MTQLSPRDMVLLTILVEMYGAPVDLVTSMLGLSQRRTYYVLAKWTAAQMISPHRVKPVAGPAWVYPTRAAGEALTGRRMRAWMPTPKMAAHVRTVLEVRLALVGLDLDRWLSERAMRSEQPPTRVDVPRVHVHDGRYLTASGDWWAVEVELSPKDIRAAKTAVARAVQVAKSADCAGLTYYYRGKPVENVIRSAAEGLALDGLRLRLADVDELLAKSPFSAARPGFRVIAGGASDHEISKVADRNTGKGV
ncbi:hypothetical protein [Nocardia arizonensis]|uniref:hypothetical protein n=1 Tax=Nocardia arizonensis TaxID=1141647 RepID=UPI0006D0289E|nr:hypothetical protein [Nocardia arizonensis]